MNSPFTKIPRKRSSIESKMIFKERASERNSPVKILKCSDLSTESDLEISPTKISIFLPPVKTPEHKFLEECEATTIEDKLS